MSNVERVVEQVRASAGADFAFVLTRKGRLVTRAAPPNMPEVGRMRLVRAARPLVGTNGVTEVTMPREEIVPYGGAAPVDVYVAVAAEQAVLCVVMPTWADKARVLPALQAGLVEIEPLLRRGVPKARKTLLPDVPATGSPYPPPQPAPSPRQATAPEIQISQATLGRETLVAIERESGVAPTGRETLSYESRPSVPRPSGSAPEIRIGEAPLGRETLAAIDQELVPQGMKPAASEGRNESTSSPEHIRIELESFDDLGIVDEPQRVTQPWVELPADTKRAIDAAIMARKLAPPKVSVRLEEADQAVLDVARSEGDARPQLNAKRSDAAPASERRRNKR